VLSQPAITGETAQKNKKFGKTTVKRATNFHELVAQHKLEDYLSLSHPLLKYPLY
jgi:hypothetical protein